MNDNNNMDSFPEINKFCLWIKKSLKIPKGLSESVYRRTGRQHNGLKKKDKRTNNDLQNIHIKLKIE